MTLPANLPLKDILEQLRNVSSMPFEQANPIPAASNHSDAFLALEQEKIFSKEWICVGREDEIPEHGDYLTDEIAGVSILIVRQQDLSIQAFVNACAHRFACLMPKARGQTKKFTCRYHGWTYSTEGHLIGAPYMEMKEGFDKSRHFLQPLHHTTWEGFLYVTLNENPHNQEQALRPLKEGVVGRYGMACYQTVFRETMIWEANWKNLMENFIESYHVPIAHGKTFARHDKPLMDYICGEDSDRYCYHRAPQPSESGLGAAHPNNNRLEGEWRRMMIDFSVFPCQLITLMPDYLWWISVQPRGTDKMLATWGIAFPPEVIDDVLEENREKWVADFKAYMDVANNEDKEIVEALHIGTKSPLLPQGEYNPIEKNLWQFNRYLAKMLC